MRVFVPPFMDRKKNGLVLSASLDSPIFLWSGKKERLASRRGSGEIERRPSLHGKARSPLFSPTPPSLLSADRFRFEHEPTRALGVMTFSQLLVTNPSLSFLLPGDKRARERMGFRGDTPSHPAEIEASFSTALFQYDFHGLAGAPLFPREGGLPLSSLRAVLAEATLTAADFLGSFAQRHCPLFFFLCLPRRSSLGAAQVVEFPLTPCARRVKESCCSGAPFPFPSVEIVRPGASFRMIREMISSKRDLRFTLLHSPGERKVRSSLPTGSV